MASPSRLPSRRLIGGSKARPISMFDMPTTSDDLKRLQQASGDGAVSANTDRQAKRRSLLPTFSSRKPSGDGKDSMGMIKEDTSDSETSSTRQETEDDTRAMPPPPKPNTRSTSLRRPAAPTISTRAASKGTHSKSTSQSSVTDALQKADSTLSRGASTRLPQSRIVGPAVAAGGHQSVPARSSSTRASTSSTLHKRPTTSGNKMPALDTSAQQSNGATQASQTSPTGSATSRQGGRSQMPSSLKPAFSTYQQHYSPAKSALPKPPVPDTRTPKPAAPTNEEPEVAITIDVALEQIELFQLSLLHQAAGETMQNYESSAKFKLLQQHSKLQEDYEEICADEKEQRTITNLSALESWCPDPALLAEHLQTLSRVYMDLRAHTEPGSRFSDLTDAFDKWATKAESILLDAQHPATFIEALPETWRSAHTSLALKLRSIQRDIGGLPPPPPRSEAESSLEILLDNCSSLVDGMLRELEVMTKLQKEVLQRGKTRIDEQISALVNATETTRVTEKEKWVPAWNMT